MMSCRWEVKRRNVEVKGERLIVMSATMGIAIDQKGEKLLQVHLQEEVR